jgi:hypothetical protein
MGLFSSIGRAARNTGRFISTTGAGALRAVGTGAADVKKLAGEVNTATGGLAGMAYEAAKLTPGLGQVANLAEKGLNAAETGSRVGLNAIELGNRAAGVRNIADAASVFGDAKGLYSANVPASVQRRVSSGLKRP